MHTTCAKLFWQHNEMLVLHCILDIVTKFR